jgi:hypothetical protein
VARTYSGLFPISFSFSSQIIQEREGEATTVANVKTSEAAKAF